MVYFKKIDSFLVWDASLVVTVGSRQCLDMTVGKIENGLEHGFLKHRLKCLLITDPKCLFQLRAVPLKLLGMRSIQNFAKVLEGEFSGYT